MKKRKIQIFTLACAVAAAVSAEARETAMSQSEALDYILRNSPAMRAADLRAKADSLSAADDATGLGETEAEFEHLWGPDGNRRWSAGVSQSFDWPGAYGARRRAAAAHARAYRYGVEAERRNLAYDVKQRMADAVYATKKLELTRSVCRNIDSLAAYVEEGHRLGQLTILDVKKSRLEQFNARVAVADAEHDLADALNAVDALAGNAEMPRVDYGEYIAEPLLEADVYRRYNADNNPDAILPALQAEAAVADAEAAKLSRLPGFSLGYTHAYEDNTHFNGLTVSIGIDLFRGRRNVAAAKLQYQAAALDAAGAYAVTDLRTNRLYDVARQRSARLRELSEVTLDSSYPQLLMMALKGGEINVIDYLREINYYDEAQQNLLAADYRLRQTLITLNRYNP